MRASARPTIKGGIALVGLALTCCATFGKVARVVADGESRTLRERASESRSAVSGQPLLILAIDGLGRDLLYGMLRHGELPEVAALLGGDRSSFPHAYFASDVLTTLPSTTGAAWATIFTGVGPAVHGFSGNEFFVRESHTFAAPIPVSVHASTEALSVFTDGYANKFLSAPTIYEQMRAREPNIDIWVSMSQFYRGADRLLMTRRGVLGAALSAFLAGHTEHDLPRQVWADLDKEDVEVVVEKLGKSAVPDVLTVYLFGTDDWAHISPEGPDVARTAYLKEVIDPAVGSLRRALQARQALDDRYVVLVSDHGHTEVVKDAAHALATGSTDDPPALLARAGYRVRPYEADVAADNAFQSVLAYQGAMAYVYLADRSTCLDGSAPCDWTRPPRYDRDVLPAADAFYTNNLDGKLVPAMRGTLDMVLTRKPVPVEEADLPFEVYIGDGKTIPIDAALAQHPRPTYVALTSRLRDLAVGPHGERAGDVLLIAHNGDRTQPEERYYFATPYHSWHGSPSVADSRIPLIVAQAQQSGAELERLVEPALGQHRAEDVGNLLVTLRCHSLHPAARGRDL